MADIPVKNSRGITTGLVEIDGVLGGAVPRGSLVLVEGKHAAGKTVLCQHLTHSALAAQLSAACYTSETGSPSLLSQMASLGMDVMDYFLLDRLRIYPLELGDRYPAPDDLLDVLLAHVAALPPEFQLVVVDSLTAFLPGCSRGALLDFLIECRQLCSRGLTIVLTLDGRRGVEPIVAHMSPWCDVHLSLQMEACLVERVVKTMRVVKTRREQPGEGTEKVHFDVRPGLGIDILWPRRSLP